MDSLIIVAIIAWFVVSSMNKQKKRLAKTAAAPPPSAPAAAAKETAEQTTMLGDPVTDMRPERMIPEPMIPEPMAAEAPARSGSLPGRSMEGVDPCHPRGENPREARRMEHRLRPHPEIRETAYDEEELLPELTAESMRQAVVMSEILTRPCERRRYP